MSEYAKKIEVKNALYEFLRPHSPIIIHLIDKAIDIVPTADVQEVRHGKWVYNENGCISCSECKASFAFRDEIWFKSDNKYCPNCGAKMDGE